MAQEVILPRQGQSVETCHILNWKKKVGDPVSEGEILVEVETDKAAFEVESTASGTLLHIFHQEGEDVPVLSALALVGEKGEGISGLTGAKAGAEEKEPAESASAEPSGAGPAPAVASTGKVAISPRARRLAEKRGLSPTQIAGALGEGRGSGPRGRILERDVRSVVEQGGLPAAAPPPAEFPGPVTEIPVKGVRKLIAERMHASLQGTAQYTIHASAPAESLLAFRQKLKGSPEHWSLREVTINDLMNYAVTRVLTRHPEVNAHFLGDRVLHFQRVHLAVAVDTPRGLMVPVVRNADALSLRQLAAEAARLRAACLDNKIGPDELSGGTFTVTNLGGLGVERFTPVLNPPQAAILGVGSIELRPVEEEDEVAFRRTIGLSLTANHQVLDGAPAARFLQELCAAVADFELLLAG